MNEQCLSCFGRGYRPSARKPSGTNPCGLGFYARNCQRCNGAGSIDIPAADYGYLQHGHGTAGPFRTESVPIRNELARDARLTLTSKDN